MMDDRTKVIAASQAFAAISRLVQNDTSIQEAEAVRFSAYYDEWDKTKSYSTSSWRRWGYDGTGKPVLYTSIKNVSAGGLPPDQNTQYWKKLG
jgi:hypothetical protein